MDFCDTLARSGASSALARETRASGVFRLRPHARDYTRVGGGWVAE
jgi:hypothetical protein